MKIRWQVLKGQKEAGFLLLDLALLVLISLNLLWLLADAILLNSGIGVLLGRHFPAFINHYREHWHNDLLVYDSYFTLFLIAELLLRWGVAIWRRTYYRWFFYPFVRWYDVLGCIPLPPFRALRLLRLVSIVYRLQKLGVIDLSESSPFVVLQKYYRIVIEELSDRIVVNVLEGVQREIRDGGPLTHRLANDVLKPHRDVIVPWLAELLAETSEHAYDQHRERLPVYLEDAVRRAIGQSPEFRKLKRRLLFAGPTVEEELQKIVSGLLVQLTDQVLTDLGQSGNVAVTDVANALFSTATAPNAELDRALRHILLDALELVKNQVQVQHWKAGGPPDTSAAAKVPAKVPD